MATSDWDLDQETKKLSRIIEDGRVNLKFEGLPPISLALSHAFAAGVQYANRPGLLTDKIRTMMSMGRKATGNKQDALHYIEEYMTGEEYTTIKAFFDWTDRNDRSFGHGNVDRVWKDWQLTLRR